MALRISSSEILRKLNEMPSELSVTDVSEKLRSVLKQIYPRQITREKVFKERNIIIKKVLEEFKQKCITICPIFKLLFNRYFYTGSAYEDLQVKDPVEFDVDIVLKLPVNKRDQLNLQESLNPLSFCTLKVIESSSDWFPKLSRFFDKDNYLIGKEVLSWLQSLVDKVLLPHDFKERFGIDEITKTTSGPAITIKLRLGEDWLSVDLVPVFQVNFETNLEYITQSDRIVNKEDMSSFFLVPKPLKDFNSYQLTKVESSKLWRIHFAEVEGTLLKKRLHLKPIIKLVKCFRDMEKWAIPSYFIKTIAFWMIKENPDPQYFHERNMGARLLEMLDHLQHSLERKHLGHIFYTQFNILPSEKFHMMAHVSNRLKKITSNLHKDPNSAKGFFKFSKSRKFSETPKRKRYKTQYNSCRHLAEIGIIEIGFILNTDTKLCCS